MSYIFSARARIAGAAIVLSLCSMAGQAYSPAFPVPQQVVRFADLNLAVSQGAETLYARIRGAARNVCGPEDDKNLALVISQRACVEKAIADAVTQVGNAQLRAVYEAHQGHAQLTRTAALIQR